MKIKNMKHIHNTLLAAGWLLAATALWSGCSEQEELMGETEGKVIAEQPGSFTFTLKGTTTPNTRATEEALSDEKEIKTLYVAFFIKNESEEEGNSKLNKIFFLDESQTTAGDWGVDDATFTKMKIAKTADSDNYTIAEPGYTGDYHVYFIANPEAAIIAKLKEYQKSTGDTRTTLGTFETEVTAAGTAKDASRGFTMTSKELIAIGDGAKSYAISLTRLAARFDFVNSAPTLATITSVTFNNEATKSFVADQTTTPAENLVAGAGSAKTWPTTPDVPTSMTVYTYENLNVASGTNTNFTTITVKYKLSGTNKTLKIELKEKDVALAVLRNHLYRINLNCLTGTYEMTVTDWKGGETVTISNKELAVKYTADDKGKIGDYVYNNNGELAFSDGGLRTMYLDGTLEWEATRPEAKTGMGTCVGIVFSNLTSDKDQAKGWKRGYVLATKYAGKVVQWNTTVNAPTEIPTFSTIQQAINDLDGYTYCQQANKTNQEAIRVAMAHSVAIPATTTSGWYLPTIGQLSVFARNITGADGLTTKTGDLNQNGASRYDFNAPDCGKKISELFKQIPADEFDAFDTTEGDVLWLSTSSQGPKHSARAVWTTSKSLYHIKFDVERTDKYSNSRVRPVFAF